MPSTIDDSVRVWTLPECDPKLKEYFILSPFTECDRATWRGYDRVYSHYLKHLRHEPINIMEVGLESGYGALAWARYFHNSNVYGMDINKEWLSTYEDIKDKYPQVKDRLHFRCPASSLHHSSWSEFNDDFFDIIIDDGDHRFPSMYSTFYNSIKKLKPGGWYFIEDIHLYLEIQVQEYLKILEPIVTEYNATIYCHNNYNAKLKYASDPTTIDPDFVNYIIAIQKPRIRAV